MRRSSVQAHFPFVLSRVPPKLHERYRKAGKCLVGLVQETQREGSASEITLSRSGVKAKFSLVISTLGSANSAVGAASQ